MVIAVTIMNKLCGFVTGSALFLLCVCFCEPLGECCILQCDVIEGRFLFVLFYGYHCIKNLHKFIHNVQYKCIVPDKGAFNI